MMCDAPSAPNSGKLMDLIASTGNQLRFWNLQTSDPLRTIASPCPQGITCMTTDKPNPRRLYLGTSHGGIAVMHVVTGQVGTITLLRL